MAGASFCCGPGIWAMAAVLGEVGELASEAADVADSAASKGGSCALVAAQQPGRAVQGGASGGAPGTEVVAAVQLCEVGVQPVDLGGTARRQLSAVSDQAARLLFGTAGTRPRQGLVSGGREPPLYRSLRTVRDSLPSYGSHSSAWG